MAVIESRLAYRIRRMTSEERSELRARLGITRNTLWRRLNEPGTFSLDDAAVIQRFLEELDNESYDLVEMLRPIALT